MPYINKEDRSIPFAVNIPQVEYMISNEINEYLKAKGLTTQIISDILGALGVVELGLVIPQLFAIPRSELASKMQKVLVEYFNHKRVLFPNLVLNSVYEEILGVLRSCGAEFVRRVVVPFHNQNLSQNGDVYNYTEEIQPNGK